MRVLALDLATRTGWAALGRDGVAYGHVDLPKTGHNVGKFLEAWRSELVQLIHRSEPELVVFEAPILFRISNIATSRKLQGLTGLTELVCRDHKLRCNEVEVRAVRHFFIGKNPKREIAKAETIAECQRRGWNPKTDDEADALAILALAAHAHRLPLGEAA